jgi:hypothetical protein
LKKILVPTDFTPKEQIERDFAWKLAKGLNASLTFLHVFELFHIRQNGPSRRAAGGFYLLPSLWGTTVFPARSTMAILR